VSTSLTTPATGRLAINRLKERMPLAAVDVDAFISSHQIPIVEGARCTFLFRGEADEVHVAQRIVGLPNRLPLKRLRGTDLWYLVLELPKGSRIEYQIEVRRGAQHERFNDPLNPMKSHSPLGSSSVCFAYGYDTPEWTLPDPDARPGELRDLVLPSRALRRDTKVTVYLPARFRPTASYPLLVVHDGGDFLQYAAAKTVLDNLIHRLEVAELIAVFTRPGNRLVEYANGAAHARYIAAELVPIVEEELPLAGVPAGRCLMGSSFGGIASLSTAVRYPGHFGSLLLQSASFVFTDIGTDHGGGPAFDPVVKFVNRYREHPVRVVEKMFASCGVYEPLITGNRAMMPVFTETGMEVKYLEARDGHNWESWRDRLRDGLSWLFPGPQKYYYE
jgi:enterochelin esterase family protein